MVVAAKMTTSRCSWTKTLMADAWDPRPAMEAKLQVPARRVPVSGNDLDD
jgi:hypothetical protein